jgi:hypothetical protein
MEKRVIIDLQEEVRRKRRVTTDEDILLEAKDWVSDPRQTRTREAKYFRLTETY